MKNNKKPAPIKGSVHGLEIPNNYFQHHISTPEQLLIVEKDMAIARLNHKICDLKRSCDYVTDHYQIVVSECAALYKMNGVEYAVSMLDSDATHRLPESVMYDIRAALRGAA